MDEIKHKSEHQMHRILEFEVKINASFSTIKQKKNEIVTYFLLGRHPGWPKWKS